MKTLFCNELEVIWAVDSTEITKKATKKNAMTDNKIVLLLKKIIHCAPFFFVIEQHPGAATWSLKAYEQGQRQQAWILRDGET